MKKLYFAFTAILFALFSMVSFTACSSDDDDTPSTEVIKNNIVGMWQTTHIAGWGYDDTEDENLIKVDQDVPEEKSERILFKGVVPINGIGIWEVTDGNLQITPISMRFLVTK